MAGPLRPLQPRSGVMLGPDEVAAMVQLHSLGWPNFSPAEIACRGTGKLLVNEPALDKLQALRDRLGKPLIVRSACRSPEHNRVVGGAKASKYLEGIAFDIVIATVRRPSRRPRGRRASRASASIRAGASSTSTSGRRAAGRALPEAAVCLRRRDAAGAGGAGRELEAEGWGAAGVATVGAAGVEVAQQVLAETQGAILPLVPYLDTLRRPFIATALAGIAIAISARLDDWRQSRR